MLYQHINCKDAMLLLIAPNSVRVISWPNVNGGFKMGHEISGDYIMNTLKTNYRILSIDDYLSLCGLEI
jgi:hypothetical protein